MNLYDDFKILYGKEYDKPILGLDIRKPERCADCIYKSWAVCPCKCSQKEKVK